MFDNLNSDFPVLGFGTSKLGHYSSQKNGLESLHLAFEYGIRYFDTAPIYGYGWSEKLLGRFIQDKRSEVIVATKIGLQPSQILSSLPYGVLSGMRNVAKKFSSFWPASVPLGVKENNSAVFDPHSAIRSLHQSLKRLKTDYVDVLLLHEANIAFANAPDTKAWVENILQSGMVRFVGLGSDLNKMKAFDTLDPVYKILQHEYSILDHLRYTGHGVMHNVHGLMTNMKVINELSKDQNLSHVIREKWGLDIGKAKDVLHLCLAAASQINPKGITLFSATQPDHVKETIRSWNANRQDAKHLSEIISEIQTHTQQR